jgi:acetoin utilization protein AcuB
MLVGMWMTPAPLTVTPETALSEAAVLMARRRLRHLPVTRGTRLVGIVSAHDVARAYPPDLNPFSAVAQDRCIARPVGHVMTTTLRTVSPGTAIEEAAGLFVAHKIGALPVVVGRELVGVLSEVDVVRAFREMLGAGEAGVHVTFDVTAHDDAIGAALALARPHRLVVDSVSTMHHEARCLAVVRLSGAAVDAFVDDLWRTGHRVLAVVRTAAAAVSRPSVASAPAPRPGA